MRTVKMCPQCGETFMSDGRPEWRFCSVPCRKEATIAKRSVALTAERLREAVCYDPESGSFKQLKHARSGKSPGWKDELGYIHIRVCNKLYLAHRLAWLYVYGQWPRENLDHINGCPSDNRIANLREAPQRLNMRNTVHKWVNSSIKKGVSFDPKRKKYRAYIKVDGKQIHKRFNTLEEAVQYRATMEAEHYGEYARSAS